MQVYELEKISVDFKKMCIENETIALMDNSGCIRWKKNYESVWKNYFNFFSGDIILSPDGNTLVIFKNIFACKLGVDVYNLNDNKCKSFIYNSGYIEKCYFSPCGEILFVQTDNKQIIFFDKYGEYLFTNNDCFFSFCNFSKDGKTFYYDTIEYIITSQSENGNKINKIIKKDFDIDYISSFFIHDVNFFICQNNEIYIFSIETNKLIKKTKYFCDQIKKLQYSPNKLFFCFFDNFKIKIYNNSYGFLDEIILEENFDYTLTNNNLFFLNDKSQIINFNLVDFLKKENIFYFLLGKNQKESKIFVFDDNQLSDSKNLIPLIFNYIS